MKYILLLLTLTLVLETKAQRFVSTVGTIEELVALNPLDVQRTNVFVTDPSRGGLFIRRPSIGVTTNAYAKYRSNHTPSYFFDRQYSGEIDVRWTGAVGDGTTDSSALIQSLADSIGVALAGAGPWRGGNTLLFPPGQWKLTSTLTLPPNVSVVGAGPSATIILGPTNASVLKVTGDPNVTMKVRFKDFTIDGGGGVLTNTTGYGIELGGASIAHEIVIEDVDIWRCKSGIWVTNGQVGRIAGCKLRNNADSGLKLVGFTTAFSIFDNYFANNRTNGFYAIQMSYSHLSGNASDANGAAGYKIDTTALTSSSNNSLVSNGAEGNPIGFDLDTCYELSLVGNYAVNASTYGCRLSGCPGPTLINCKFDGTTEDLFVTSSAISGLGIYSVTAVGGIFTCNYTNALITVGNTGFRDSVPHTGMGQFPDLLYPLSITGPNQHILNFRRLAATNFQAEIDNELAFGIGTGANPGFRVMHDANTNNPPTAASAGFGVGYPAASILAPLVVNGNAGVGTNNPQARLHISRTNAATPQLLIDNPGPTPTLAGLAIYGSGSGVTSARNWAMVINQDAYGDFQLKQSLTNASDPLGGSNIFRVSPAGVLEVLTTLNLPNLTASKFAKLDSSKNLYSTDVTAADVVGAATLNPTTGRVPVRVSASAFGDSPVSVVSSNQVTQDYRVADEFGPTFLLLKQGRSGATGSNTNSPVSGAQLGVIGFGGWNGTSDVYGQSIRAITTDSWTPATTGYKLDFYTIPTGASTQSLSMTIEQNGKIKVPQLAANNYLGVDGSNYLVVTNAPGAGGTNAPLWATTSGNLFPSPAVDVVSITSQSADNSTNVALMVGTSITWTNGGKIFKVHNNLIDKLSLDSAGGLSIYDPAGLSYFFTSNDDGGSGAILRRMGVQSPDGAQFVQGVTEDGVAALYVRAGNNTDAVEMVATNGLNRITMDSNSSRVFHVDNAGNVIKLRSLDYDWPNAHGAGTLANDGAGNLSWTGSSGAISRGVYQGAGSDHTVGLAPAVVNFGTSGNVDLTLPTSGHVYQLNLTFQSKDTQTIVQSYFLTNVTATAYVPASYMDLDTTGNWHAAGYSLIYTNPGANSHIQLWGLTSNASCTNCLVNATNTQLSYIDLGP